MAKTMTFAADVEALLALRAGLEEADGERDDVQDEGEQVQTDA